MLVRLTGNNVVLPSDLLAKIRLPNGAKGSLADLETGDAVAISGVVNKRLDEVTSAYQLRITNLPRKKP